MEYRYTTDASPILLADNEWTTFESGYAPRSENLLTIIEEAATARHEDDFDATWPVTITIQQGGNILGSADVSMSLEPVFVARAREEAIVGE